MTRRLDLVFYLAALAFAIASAAGAAPAPTPPPVATDVVPEAVLRSVVEGWVREQIEQTEPADNGTRYEIEARWQGDILLETPGQVDFRVRRLSSRPFRGPTVVRLELSVDGQLERATTVTVDCRYYRPVVMTTRSIRRHDEISEDALVVAERDVTGLKNGWFESLEDLTDMRAARPIGVGDVVSERHVEPVPVVFRGQDVVMSLQTGNMVLEAVGQALSDGGPGERIRVRNVDSGKVVFGQVTADGIVRITGG